MELSFTKEPREVVDLHYKLESDGTTANQNQTVTATVRDGSGTQITGSPFSLTHEANGRYVLRSAFTLASEGIWTVDYNVANDRWADGLWVIDCKYETLPLGGEGGINTEAIKKLFDNIPNAVWRYDTSRIKNDKTAIRQILNKLNIQIPENNFDEIITEIKKIPRTEINEHSLLMSLGNMVDQRLSSIGDIVVAINNLESSLKIITNSLGSIKVNQNNNFTDVKKSLGGLNKNDFEKIRITLNRIFGLIKGNSVMDELSTILVALKNIKSEIKVIDYNSNKYHNAQSSNIKDINERLSGIDNNNVKRLGFITDKIISRINSVFKPEIQINMADGKKFRR